MKEFRYNSEEAYEKAIADLEKEINDKYLAGKSYEERLPLFRQKEELEGEYGAFKRLNVKVGDGVTYVAGYYGLGGDEYPATVIKRTAKTLPCSGLSFQTHWSCNYLYLLSLRKKRTTPFLLRIPYLWDTTGYTMTPSNAPLSPNRKRIMVR